MMRVLRRLGFIDNDNVVQLKGRTACEISACDELLASELIFNGVFSDLSVEHTVALLSALVHTEKGNDGIKVRDDLAGPFRQLQEAARRVAKVRTSSTSAKPCFLVLFYLIFLLWVHLFHLLR